MLHGDILLLFPVLLPILAGLLIQWCKPLQSAKPLRVLVGVVLVAELGLILATDLAGSPALTLWRLTDNLSVTLRPDGMGRLFATLFAFIWAVVGFYSFEYMKHEEKVPRYFTFYLLAEAAILGIALSGNIVTLYMFYEFMTLAVLPLVLHEMTKEAIAAGIKYLLYSLFGAAAALAGIFFLNAYGVSLDFTPGGVLDAAKVAGREPLLLAIFFVMILGFSVKAGMFPLHGWLPTAHPVAPASASAVLSGIITKTGVLGIIRVIFYLVGPDFLRGTWVQYAFMTLTLITVFMGSMLAFKENEIKKRLAYSTVSQVSYVLFGLSTMTPLGVVGALMHVVFHSVIKNNLFMSAGAIIYKTGKRQVKDMYGIGRQMPVTMWCFTLVSLGLIGIPPTSGFISKWYLAQGALSLGTVTSWIGPAVLLVSALLTAGYLITVAIHGFFPGADAPRYENIEPSPMMTIPMILLAALTVLLGMFPAPLIQYLTGLVSAIV